MFICIVLVLLILDTFCHILKKFDLKNSGKSNQSDFYQRKNVENLSPKETSTSLYTSRLLSSIEKISITLKSILIKEMKVEKERMEYGHERRSEWKG